MSTTNDNKTAIFVPTVSEDGTKLLQNFNMSVTQSVQGGGLEFEVTRNNYTLPLDHEIKYHDQTPTQDSGVSLYVKAPTTNNNLYETIAQKFQLEVGYAKIETDGTQDPIESGVHTVEEIYLPSGLTIDGWNFLTDYVYIKGMNGGAPFYRRFKFVGNGRDCMVGEDIPEADMKASTLQLRPSGFSWFARIEAAFLKEYNEAHPSPSVDFNPTVHRIFLPNGVTEWDETIDFHIAYNVSCGRFQLAANPAVPIITYTGSTARDCYEIFRDPSTTTPLQKLVKGYRADRLLFNNYTVEEIKSIWKNLADPEMYIFVHNGSTGWWMSQVTLSGSSSGYKMIHEEAFTGIGSRFLGFVELPGMRATDVTLPKLHTNTSGGDFQINPVTTAIYPDAYKMFDGRFDTFWQTKNDSFVSIPGVLGPTSGLPTEDDDDNKFLIGQDKGYSTGPYCWIDFGVGKSFNAFRLAQHEQAWQTPREIALFGRNEPTDDWKSIGGQAFSTHTHSQLANVGQDYTPEVFVLAETVTYKSVIIQVKQNGLYFEQHAPWNFTKIAQFQLLML